MYIEEARALVPKPTAERIEPHIVTFLQPKRRIRGPDSMPAAHTYHHSVQRPGCHEEPGITVFIYKSAMYTPVIAPIHYKSWFLLHVFVYFSITNTLDNFV